MPQNGSEQFVVVAAGPRRALARISEVREIVPLLSLTEVAGRGGSFRGVANLRGESIPIFDWAGPDAPMLPSRLILIMTSAGSSVGLIVDEVHDVATVSSADVTTHPIGGGRTAIIARVGEEMLPVLNAAATVEATP